MSLSDLTRVSTAMIQGLPLLSGGASQTLESILTERVSVKRFGAKGDGSHDDTAAIQAALTWAIAHGARLYLPCGRYKITAGLVADLSANTADSGNRLCLEGDGPGNSVFVASLAADSVLLRIKGGGGSGSGMHAWSEIGGFGIELAGANAYGLFVENFAFFKMYSIRIIGAKYGMYLRDVLSGLFEKLNIRFCIYGIYGDRNDDGSSDLYKSGPNNLNFVACTVGLCTEWGVTLVQGAVCNWIGGSVEHCGAGGAGADRYGVLISSAGLEGGVGATFQGVYFEGNVGWADIWISQGANQAAYLIDGCTFNRIHTPTHAWLTAPLESGGVPTTTNTGIPNPYYQRYTSNNIRVQTNSRPVSVTITGCGFRSLGAFPSAPYIDDAARPYIAYADSPLIDICQFGNLFDGAVATPYWSRLPSFRAYMGGDQSFAVGETLVAFNAPYQNDGYSYDADNARFTAYRRMRMFIQASVFWTDMPSGADHSISIFRNGARYAGAKGHQISTSMDVNPGDVVQIKVYQASGASRTISHDALYSFFSGHVI